MFLHFSGRLLRVSWSADYIPPLEEYIAVTRNIPIKLTDAYFLDRRGAYSFVQSHPRFPIYQKKTINLKKTFHLFHQILKKLPLRPEISLGIAKKEVLKSPLNFDFPIHSGRRKNRGEIIIILSNFKTNACKIICCYFFLFIRLIVLRQ